MARPGSNVIVWGESIAHGPGGEAAVEELLACAQALDAKLIEVPESANGRGLREAGLLPGIGPGFDGVPDWAGTPRASGTG